MSNSDDAGVLPSGNDLWRRPAGGQKGTATPEPQPEPIPAPWVAPASQPSNEESVEQDGEREAVAADASVASAAELAGTVTDEPVAFPPPPPALNLEHVPYQPYSFGPVPAQTPESPTPAAATPFGQSAATVVPAPPVLAPTLTGVQAVSPAETEGMILGLSTEPSSSALRTDLAAVSSNRRRKVQLRASVTVLLFTAGLLGGILLVRMPMAAPAAPSDSFPALARSTVEPLPASAVAQNLQRNDVHGLAQLVDGDTLTAIQSQLNPLVSIEQVTFVGSTILGPDTIAGYVVRGRDQSGNLGLVGLTIRVRNGQVVAQ